MVFSSLVFMCIMMPVVWLLHYIIPNLRIRNGLLLAASLLFYAYGEPVYVLLMLGSSMANYLLALLMRRRPNRFVLFLAVVINIGVLVVFKYTGFLVESLNRISGMSLPVPAITLPIGISFFTFQALSYVIDVYRGKVKVQYNYFRLLLYISFFPQLIAGPIVRYIDIAEEIAKRKVKVEEAAFGLRRFIFGLSKKVLIANAMAVVVDRIFAASWSEWSALTLWIGALAYIMQIYYDFSGYSDMAIGLGEMFGFHFNENFNYPYLAVSIKDFWRRWHISLSTWFRDYVYIPLGGNRKGKIRTVLNKMIVFFLTGLWHGANWTFVVWGLYHGFFLLLEEFLPILERIPKWIRRILSLMVVTIGFVVFRADTLQQALIYIAGMFVASGPMAFTLHLLTPYFLVMFVLAVLLCGPLVRWTKKNITDPQTSGLQTLSFVLAFALLAWCMLRLSAGSYNPFIYFRF